jgi:hypothetical protein
LHELLKPDLPEPVGWVVLRCEIPEQARRLESCGEPQVRRSPMCRPQQRFSSPQGAGAGITIQMGMGEQAEKPAGRETTQWFTRLAGLLGIFEANDGGGIERQLLQVSTSNV